MLSDTCSTHQSVEQTNFVLSKCVQCVSVYRYVFCLQAYIVRAPGPHQDYDGRCSSKWIRQARFGSCDRFCFMERSTLSFLKPSFSPSRCETCGCQCRRIFAPKDRTKSVLRMMIAGSPCVDSMIQTCCASCCLMIDFPNHCCISIFNIAQDYSLFGQGNGLQGRTIPFLLIFLKMILQSLPDVVIHENVTQMPENIITDILSSGFLSVLLTQFRTDDCSTWLLMFWIPWNQSPTHTKVTMTTHQLSSTPARHVVFPLRGQGATWFSHWELLWGRVSAGAEIWHCHRPIISQTL